MVKRGFDYSLSAEMRPCSTQAGHVPVRRLKSSPMTERAASADLGATNNLASGQIRKISKYSIRENREPNCNSFSDEQRWFLKALHLVVTFNIIKLL